ncbi:hypothetical protein GCM10020227_18350 [Streptomyces flavovirens]
MPRVPERGVAVDGVLRCGGRGWRREGVPASGPPPSLRAGQIFPAPAPEVTEATTDEAGSAV